MKTFEIELIDIGRNHHSEIINRNFMDKATACQFAIEEASKYLMSSDISMNDDDSPNVFTVSAGFRTVGVIKIEENKNATLS